MLLQQACHAGARQNRRGFKKCAFLGRFQKVSKIFFYFVFHVLSFANKIFFFFFLKSFGRTRFLCVFGVVLRGESQGAVGTLC